MNHADVLAWWALALAALAIVLHIPLSMAAHYYLPKVEDYFASRSREKLTARIAELQHQLAQLNDPKYFEDLEWRFQEQLFSVTYLFGVGFLALAGSLLLATGAVPMTSKFWNPRPLFPGWLLPVLVVASFTASLAVSGWNMFQSAALRPSKRPKLISDIQAQIDALKIKLDEFTPMPPRPSIMVNGV